MEKFYQRKYKLVKSENFEEALRALGVNLFIRKMGNMISPTVELGKAENNSYTLKMSSPLKSNVQQFKLGEEFSDITPDGRNVKTTFHIIGNKLFEKQKGEDGKITSIQRIFTKDEVRTIIRVDNVAAFRVYKYIG